MGRSRSRSRSRERHRGRHRSPSDSREQHRSRRRSRSYSPSEEERKLEFNKLSFYLHINNISKAGSYTKDKFKEFRSRPPNGGFVSRGKNNQFSEEYFEYRRKEREQISTTGVPSAWSNSPLRIEWYFVNDVIEAFHSLCLNFEGQIH